LDAKAAIQLKKLISRTRSRTTAREGKEPEELDVRELVGSVIDDKAT
jgi:hypothetical protein